MNFCENLTIVMPTYNGAQRVNAVCEWLKRQCFIGTLLIISADEKALEIDRKSYEFLQIIYKPNLGIIASISLGFFSVTTAFCCYIGDDDFPNVAGLDACCSFLQDNPDFDSARGSVGYVHANSMFKLLNSEQRPTLSFLLRLFFSNRYDSKTDLSTEAPNKRVLAIEAKYIVTQFFVIRRDIAKKIYGNGWLKITGQYSAEVASCVAHAWLVKTALLPRHMLLRGYGDHRKQPRVEMPSYTFNQELGEYFSSFVSSKNEMSLLIECTNNLVTASNKNKFEAIKNEMQKKRFGHGFWTTLPRRLYFTIFHQPTIPWRALFGRINK